MKRFDGPADGASLTSPTPRDGNVRKAADDYASDSGSESETDPDHFCSVPRNARGVDMYLVSIRSFECGNREEQKGKNFIFKIFILDSKWPSTS